MMKDTESDKTTMIEVISFLFFTLFAMILAFFTSAKAFAAPEAGPQCFDPQRHDPTVELRACEQDEPVALPFDDSAR